ncbi:hypothetical protein POM88_047501 [Heracleum sosnowskyi]|uniref:Uncharacterized protein n=1 Tax=Heracleum sosnowskyi TaxID=360622 RepID=A0AAD8GS63_9APIA|nr:hypothetical protein POM88_047501 [Heracleum sosnowskyi]
MLAADGRIRGSRAYPLSPSVNYFFSSKRDVRTSLIKLLGNGRPEISSVKETEQLKQATDIVPIKEEITQVDPKAGEDNTTACISQDNTVPPLLNEVEPCRSTSTLKATGAVGNKEFLCCVYQQTGTDLGINQSPVAALSNGNVLPLPPRKSRTGARDRRVGDRRGALGRNGKPNVIS